MAYVWQVVYLLILLFLYILIARFVMSTVMSIGRRWRPGRGSAAALEVVWSITDPPLRGLRRVIPPLRLGNVSFDLAALVLLVIVFVLQFLLRRFALP